MKKFLITTALVVLLSVNVLTPINYAYAETGEILDEVQDDVGGIPENGSGMAENGSGSDNVLLGGKEVAPTCSGTEDFYEGDESSKNPQSSTSSNPAPLDKGAQSGGNLDSSVSPQNDNNDEQTSQNDEQDEEDIITDADLDDEDDDIAGDGFFASTEQSLSVDDHISSMKAMLSEEYKANSEAVDEEVEKERLVQYIKAHFSNGWVANKETVTLYNELSGNYISGVVWVYKYTNNIFEGMKLNPKIESFRDEHGNEVKYFLLYAEREDGSVEKDKYGTTSKYAYIWTKIGDVAKVGVTSAGRGSNRRPQVGNIWNEQGGGKGWLANEKDENGNLLYPGAQYARDLTYTEDGTPAAEARQSGVVDDTNAKQLLGWQFLLVDLSWANYREDPDNDGVLTLIHKSGDLQYDSKFATFVDERGHDERHGYYDFVYSSADINANVRGTTTVFDRNDAPLIDWDAMLRWSPVDVTLVVTFKNYDGTVLQTGAVASGSVLSGGYYTGAEPTKPSTAQTGYYFTGWTPDFAPITGETTYTAKFEERVNKYTVTFVDEDGTTVLKQATEYDYGTASGDIVKPADPTKAATAQYTYTFAGWTPELAEVTTGVTYKATYSSTVNEYTVTIESNNTASGTVSTGTITVPYGTNIDTGSSVLRIGAETSTATESTDTDQYDFSFVDWTNNCGTTVTTLCTITANFKSEVKKYTITFVDEDRTELYKYSVPYGMMPLYTGDIPTKESNKNYTYTFDKWEPEIVPVIGDATYTATYTATPIPTGGGGGGSTIKRDYCPDGDYSDSYYDGDCGEKENSEDGGDEEQIHGSAGEESKYTDEELTEDGDDEGQTHGSAGEEGGYTDEELLTYEWAYKNGITTIDNIQDANPDGYVIRGHIAKMVVNFMINVLGFEMPESMSEECLTLNNGKQPRESEEIRNYAMQACALGVMGIGVKDNNFLANDIVSRAEFGTIISRVLWGDTYNVEYTKQTPYYTKHLEALNKEGIMTQIDRPLTGKELRKRIWVMMKRIAEKE